MSLLSALSSYFDRRDPNPEPQNTDPEYPGKITCFDYDGTPFPNNTQCQGSFTCCQVASGCLPNRFCSGENGQLIRPTCSQYPWTDCSPLCLFEEGTGFLPRVNQCADGSFCCDNEPACCNDHEGVVLNGSGEVVSTETPLPSTTATPSNPPIATPSSPPIVNSSSPPVATPSNSPSPTSIPIPVITDSTFATPTSTPASSQSFSGGFSLSTLSTASEASEIRSASTSKGNSTLPSDTITALPTTSINPASALASSALTGGGSGAGTSTGSNTNLSTGALAGIGAGVGVAVILIVVAVLIFFRHRQKIRILENSIAERDRRHEDFVRPSEIGYSSPDQVPAAELMEKFNKPLPVEIMSHGGYDAAFELPATERERDSRRVLVRSPLSKRSPLSPLSRKSTV